MQEQIHTSYKDPMLASYVPVYVMLPVSHKTLNFFLHNHATYLGVVFHFKIVMFVAASWESLQMTMSYKTVRD